MCYTFWTKKYCSIEFAFQILDWIPFLSENLVCLHFLFPWLQRITFHLSCIVSAVKKCQSRFIHQTGSEVDVWLEFVRKQKETPHNNWYPHSEEVQIMANGRYWWVEKGNYRMWWTNKCRQMINDISLDIPYWEGNPCEAAKVPPLSMFRDVPREKEIISGW